MDLCWSILLVTGALAQIQEEFSYNCTTTLTCQEISGNVTVQTINTTIRAIQGERGPKGDKGDPCECDKKATSLTPYLLLTMNETTNGSLPTPKIRNNSETGMVVPTCDCEPVMDEIKNLQTDVSELKTRNISDYVTTIKGQKGERGRSCDCAKMTSEVNEIKDQFTMMRSRMRRFENQIKEIKQSNLPFRIASDPQGFLNDTLRYLPTKCAEVRGSEKMQNVTIYPLKSYLDITPFYVNCADGGWIVIQRRSSKTLSFYQKWRLYREGFGDKNGDFWIGLKTIRQLTAHTPHVLRIVMRSKGKPSETVYAEYGHFYIEDESQGYRLIVGDYTGNATDRMGANNGQKFTTSDHDVDTHSGNCAVSRLGGWWYTNCGSSLPNDGFLSYFSWGDSLIFSTMMVRPYA